MCVCVCVCVCVRLSVCLSVFACARVGHALTSIQELEGQRYTSGVSRGRPHTLAANTLAAHTAGMRPYAVYMRRIARTGNMSPVNAHRVPRAHRQGLAKGRVCAEFRGGGGCPRFSRRNPHRQLHNASCRLSSSVSSAAPRAGALVLVKQAL